MKFNWSSLNSSFNSVEQHPSLHFEEVDYRRKKWQHSCLFKNILCESCFERNFKIIISDFCPFYTKFDIYWERTALNEIVARNCSEVDPELGGRKMFWYASSKNCYLVIDTQHKFNSQALIVNSPLKLPRVTLWISYKNLVRDEGNIFYLLSLSILVTCVLDCVCILQGEVIP